VARRASTPAATALDRAGVAYALHAFDDVADAAGLGYGEAAAAALGVQPEQVFKTLVTAVTGGPGPAVVAVLPVACRLDLRALAAALGAKRAAMADPAVAERLTGYVLGGISPFGQRRALPTVVDRTAVAFATVFVSGGRRGLEIEVAPADLVRVTGASWADLAG
jgi:Cys-tRNA(Pro)/Cys-tRNA(Cys) deacylase